MSPENFIADSPMLKRYCASNQPMPCRSVICAVIALLGLCPGPVQAQQGGTAAISLQALKASWGSSAESMDFLGARELIESLQRHGSVESYKEVPASGLRLSHYVAAYSFDLPVVRRSRLKLLADVGVGATRLRTLDYSPYRSQSAESLSETYLSVRGGVTLEYRVRGEFHVFVSGREFLYLDDDDTRVRLEELGGDTRVLESGTWTFPLTFGLRLSVN